MALSAAEPKTPIRRFRPPRWIPILAGTGALLFIAVARAMYAHAGWTWITVAAGVLTLAAIAGLLDALTARVELTDDRLVVVRNLRRREYPRSDFVKVTWAKGAPVALQAASGRWVHLPEVGAGSQAMANTLRAWIKP